MVHYPPFRAPFSTITPYPSCIVSSSSSRDRNKDLAIRTGPYQKRVALILRILGFAYSSYSLRMGKRKTIIDQEETVSQILCPEFPHNMVSINLYILHGYNYSSFTDKEVKSWGVYRIGSNSQD